MICWMTICGLILSGLSLWTVRSSPELMLCSATWKSMLTSPNRFLLKMNDGKSHGVLSGAPLVIHGWSIFAHGSFLDHFESLIAEVETLKERHPKKWYRKNSAKRLLAIRKLITKTIPASPTSTQFRQGNTLGRSRKHWFRAKFYQQYRLFFQFDSVRKIVTSVRPKTVNILKSLAESAKFKIEVLPKSEELS